MRIQSRAVESHRHSFLALFLMLALVVAGCSGLNALTPALLQSAQQRWNESGPSNYRMVVEMKGDRLESSQYAVTVRAKQVVKLERNGLVVLPNGAGQDYSVEGLFHILDQEIDLAGKPEILGAPPGYASYPMAKFDAASGRLLRFQRSVGGVKNSIEINIREFEVQNP